MRIQPANGTNTAHLFDSGHYLGVRGCSEEAQQANFCCFGQRPIGKGQMGPEGGEEVGDSPSHGVETNTGTEDESKTLEPRPSSGLGQGPLWAQVS